MSKDLENLLGKNEEIVLETRQHPFIIMRDAGLVFLTLIVLAIALWGKSRADWLDNTGGKYVGYALIAGLVIAALVLMWRVLGWFTERFYLTTSKVIYARGILNRDVVTTPLVKIDEITLRRPFFGRIFGFGRLDVDNAAGGAEPLAGLEYLPKPEKIYRMVTERSRSQRLIEGGHRDDDHDGLVDEPAPRRAEPAAEPRSGDDAWPTGGSSTSGQ